MRRATGVFACAGLAVLAASCASSLGPPRRVVQFNLEQLIPDPVRIREDGNVTWVNLAPETAGYIIFPATRALEKSCGGDFSASYQRMGEGYQSLPVESGPKSRRLQLPCRLQPGEYTYEVWLESVGLGATVGERRIRPGPKHRLTGTIIVEPAPDAADGETRPASGSTLR